MKNSNTVLVTAFMPFLGETLNPSALILKDLQVKYPNSHSLHTLLLPVVFSEAAPLVLEAISNLRPDVILMLGQAGGREHICLERVALNWMESTFPDESGWTPKLGRISEKLPEAFFTDLPIQSWQQELAKTNKTVQISLSAGGYVCNHLYFSILAFLESQGLAKNACFIHVPYLPEQAVDKKAHHPSLNLEHQVAIIGDIIELVKKSKI